METEANRNSPSELHSANPPTSNPQASSPHPPHASEHHPTNDQSPQEASPNPELPQIPPQSVKRKPTRKPSEIWEFFTKKPNTDRCVCNFCDKDFACDPRRHGTSSLRGHLERCKKFPYRVDDPKQSTLLFEKKGDGTSGTVLANVFNKEACRKACAVMVVIDELPFSFVEGRGFRQFCSVACPKFEPPSRRTLVRDITQLYMDEKLALKAMLASTNQRVSLTTDCWTSIQNVSYMSLTAHYVDETWNLQKRILAFCVVPRRDCWEGY